MKNIFELKTIYDNRKNFGGKAVVEQTIENNKITYILDSYNTKVCKIIIDNEKNKELYLNKNIEENLLFSQTTLRHIKEFLKQFYGFDEYKKADLKRIELAEI